MKTRYSIPSIESIQEQSEDEVNANNIVKRNASVKKSPHHARRLSTTTMMSSAKNLVRDRDKGHRKHRGRKHQSKRDDLDLRYASSSPQDGRGESRIYHRRTLSNKSTSSTASSSDDEEETSPNHRVILQRNKLSSPSVVSTLTTLTVTTNNSSGSSGSNSTITQASVTRQSSAKRPLLPEAPVTLAVPDAPDVFAFRDTGSTVSMSEDEDEKDINEHNREEHQSEEDNVSNEEDQSDEEHVSNEEDGNTQDDEDDVDVDDNDDDDESDKEVMSNDKEISQWPSHGHSAPIAPSLSPDLSLSSPSTSSSFHGSDHLSEPSAESADNDTDRSTSPERSADNRSDRSDHERKAPAKLASAKIASQMAAAQQRQGQYTSRASKQSRSSHEARGSTSYPYVSSRSEMNHQYPTSAPTQRRLPASEEMPATGYELLATRLSHASTNSAGGEKIKPMYRKFEALNHRVLLHLQDELVELEERLRRIDHLDSEARQASFNGTVVPASRRAAQVSGRELDWHKTDVLGRIGFKLDQYNRALTTFNATQDLDPPDPIDIDQYRDYLSTEHPIAESEAHFLDPTDDLVSVSSKKVPCHTPSIYSETETSQSSAVADDPAHISPPQVQHLPLEHGMPGLAIVMAIAVLGPILTFSVIPGFIGRMAVVALVAGLVVFALMHTGAVGGDALGRDGLLCAGIYGGAMIVIAGIMG